MPDPDNIVSLAPALKPIPDEVLAAAKTLGEFFAKQGARYWECGLTGSRLYPLAIHAFAPHLKRIRGKADNENDPTVNAHNAAVAALKQVHEGKADETLFNRMKEAMKA